MRWVKPLLLLCALSAGLCSHAHADEIKPKAAVFPLSGNAAADVKERVGFAFRKKIERDGAFESIPGPTMADLVGEKAISLDTPPDTLRKLAEDEKPTVYIWGEMNESAGVQTLKINILDARDKQARPSLVTKTISDPTELRFAVEQTLETIKGIKAFEHPTEISVVETAESKRLWKTNPNLIPDPIFRDSQQWTTLYMAEKYAPPISDEPPAVDKVCILKLPAEKDAPGHQVLAMRLSKDCAENNGMACLSDFIKIEPNQRFRLQFKYKSDGPSLHVFVKGYTMAASAVGPEIVKREVYKRQVPPSGATDGKWVTVVDDLTPENPTYPVQYLRVDLYAYLTPGVVLFDDVQLRAIGKKK